MKIRHGFVTNSSSSSFICVLGEVIDKEKFEASGLGKSYYGWQFKAGWQNEEATPFYSLGADWAGVWIDEKELQDDKEYFYWEEYGGAGDDDYCFRKDPDDYDLDYDVELSDFPQDEQEKFECTVEENGLRYVDGGYGAGRNG